MVYSHELIPSSMFHLQKPSHLGLEFQYMNWVVDTNIWSLAITLKVQVCLCTQSWVIGTLGFLRESGKVNFQNGSKWQGERSCKTKFRAEARNSKKKQPHKSSEILAIRNVVEDVGFLVGTGAGQGELSSPEDLEVFGQPVFVPHLQGSTS